MFTGKSTEPKSLLTWTCVPPCHVYSKDMERKEGFIKKGKFQELVIVLSWSQDLKNGTVLQLQFVNAQLLKLLN